jgi:hypothetical protein
LNPGREWKGKEICLEGISLNLKEGNPPPERERSKSQGQPKERKLGLIEIEIEIVK